LNLKRVYDKMKTMEKQVDKIERAVIYARFSSDRQTEQSIDGQVRDCRAFCERNNYQIVAQYVDRAMSGKFDKRPDFQKMIRDSEKYAFDYVVVYTFDRFSTPCRNGLRKTNEVTAIIKPKKNICFRANCFVDIANRTLSRIV
jgi:predicted site-specific integrase-resolvase